MDGAAGALDEVKRIVARLRAQWPKVRIVLRGDSGFCREELMAWCESEQTPVQRLALKGTEWAEAQVDTIRLKLFKIGALVRISAPRVWLELNSNYPWKHIYAGAFEALRC
jgi:hypothetical protein